MSYNKDKDTSCGCDQSCIIVTKSGLVECDGCCELDDEDEDDFF